MSSKRLIFLSVASAALLGFAAPALAVTEAECDALGGCYDKGLCFIRMLPVFPPGAASWEVPQPWKTCFDSGRAIFKIGDRLVCGTISGKIDQTKLPGNDGNGGRLGAPMNGVSTGVSHPAKSVTLPDGSVVRPEDTGPK